MNASALPISFVFAAIALLHGTAASALQLVTEDNPPFSFVRDNSVAGLSTEILAEAGKRAGISMNFTLMSWGKAYETAQSKKDVCIYSTARLENRERIFKWVGPIATNTWALFAKNEFKGAIKALADARPYRIGGVVNDAKVEWLKEKAVTNITTFADDKMIPPLLTLDAKKPGAVDLWVTGLYAAAGTADSAGVRDLRMVLKVREVPYWLACNPGVDDASIKALSEALAKMQKDGTLQKMTAAYAGAFARN